MTPIGPPVAHSVSDMPNTRPSQRSWKGGSPGSGTTGPNPCMPPMSWMPSTAARLPRMSDADDLADLLLELTVSLVLELHPAIADLVMPGHFRPAGAPAAAVFLRPAEGEPTHRSGRPSPAVAELAADAADAAHGRPGGGPAADAADAPHARLGYGRPEGNPFLPCLALAAFYLVEVRRSGAFGLGELTGGRVRAYPLAPDEAPHDPPLLPGTGAIRAWYPVEGAPEACIELRLSPSRA